MTLKELTHQWLTQNGYDGLYHSEGYCACKLDDLMPCDEPGTGCKAGYLRPCDCGEGRRFHIGGQDA